MLAIDSLRAMLLAAFPGARVDVTDLTGTSDHYQVDIVAAVFRGKSALEQHRMVYGSLGEHVGKAIHALALKTSAPHED